MQTVSLELERELSWMQQIVNEDKRTKEHKREETNLVKKQERAL